MHSEKSSTERCGVNVFTVQFILSRYGETTIKGSRTKDLVVERVNMTNRIEEILTDILQTFDSFDLDKEYPRRTSVKSFWDYFQILILEVGVHFCGLNRNSLKHYHLKTRWDIVKSCLEQVEDTTRWDELVLALHKMRSSTEHTDYKVPSKTALLQIRSRIPEFKNLILKAGKMYYKESKGFSFIQKYSLLSRWYIGRADWMISQFGEKPPYCLEGEIVLPGEKHPYIKMKTLRDSLESRNREVGGINDLTQSDLDDLVELVTIVERLDVRESVLLKQNVCPKCGDKITSTHREVGGSHDDPVPSAIIYRIGCKKCDYVVLSDTIDV